MYFRNFVIMSDTVWHVSCISWISPPGILMFDANDTGPKNYDYFSPQQLYKKSDSPRLWHFSIAFQAYAAMFRRGTVYEDLAAKARIKTQTDFLFDA